MYMFAMNPLLYAPKGLAFVVFGTNIFILDEGTSLETIPMYVSCGSPIGIW